jgi:predicted DNA binding CopG/RHH family protein
MKRSKVIALKSLDEIPKFKSEEEEAEFWDTHSIAKIWNQLEKAKVELSHPLKAKINERRKAKKFISLRLEPEQIESLKTLSSKKGIGYLTLIRMWVSEKLSQERKYGHAH